MTVGRQVASARGGLVLPRWRTARPAERLGYAVGLALVGVGLLHGAVFLVDGGPWQGPVSWRKPTTFGLSFGVTVVTVTWLTTSLRLRERTRWALVGVLAVAAALEVGAVVLQAWRGVPSHFNQTTAFDAVVFASMGASVALIGGVVVVVTVLAFTASRTAPSAASAVRLGLVTLVAAQAVGGAMIGRGVAALAADDQTRAYVAGGTLKLAHAITLHGVQVLPLLAVALAATSTTEARRLRVVLVAGGGYVLITLAALASAADLPVLATATVVAGGAVLAGAVAWTGLALRRTRARRDA